MNISELKGMEINYLKKYLEQPNLEMENIQLGDLTKLSSPIKTLIYINNQLPINEKIIRTLFYLTTLEAIVSPKRKNKYKRISNTLNRYLSTHDKIEFITMFAFSSEFTFDQPDEKNREIRHVCYKDMVQNNYNYVSEYCTTSSGFLCSCKTWLVEVSQKNTLDKYIVKILEGLYEIRNSMLHQSILPLWFPDYENNDLNNNIQNATLVDAYGKRGKLFRSYESSMNKNNFYSLVTKVIKNEVSKKIVLLNKK